MRKLLPHSLALLLLCLHYQSFAQLGGVLKKVRKSVGGAGQQIIGFDEAITTSLKDTLYGITWINDSVLDPDDADSIGSGGARAFNLKPGYYRSDIRSYCLHAGVYSPSKGDGYQVARLKGAKAGMVQKILERSADHPELLQSDVQTLIWGVESGTRYTAYPVDFQLRMRPLLDEADLATMSVEAKDVSDKLLPDRLKALRNTYSSLRGKMEASQMKYDEIEEVAVKAGVPPLGPGSQTIGTNTWSYIGDGWYLKAVPKRYPTTTIELYRPAQVAVTRDSKNRIGTYSYDGYQVTIVYDDAPGSDVVAVNGIQLPVWKIKGYELRGPSAGQSVKVPVDEWLFRGSYREITALISKGSGAYQANATEIPLTGGPAAGFPDELSPDPKWERVLERYNEVKKRVDEFEEYKGYADEMKDLDKTRPLDEYIEEGAVNQNIYDGLKAALNPIDKKGQMTWIRKNLRMTMDMVMYAICQLRGGCNNNDPNTPDLPGHPAQPGNTSLQRLGLSPYTKRE